MLILRNYTISNNKEKIKSSTIEEVDDIAAVTFFAAKPQKKGKFAISLQQSKEGGDICCFFFFNTKLQPSLLCYKGKKRKRKKKKVTAVAITFFMKLRFQKREKKATATLILSPA
jgi:hypothetical protein